MPAITIVDLNNAQLDVTHIAAIATSTLPTATDRLGNVKQTVFSALAVAAQSGAKYYDTVALGLAATADTFTFGVRAGGADGFKRATLFRRENATTQTLIVDQLKAAEFDAVVKLTVNDPGYAIFESDTTGRMSRYVDSRGRTFIALHEAVQIPGTQVISLPKESLTPALAAQVLPTGYQFAAASPFALALIDATGRQSELTIDDNGRFPDWVVRAIFQRATTGAVTPNLGGVLLPEAFTDCTGLSNGTAVPFDTAQASPSFGGAPLYVSNGAVIHNAVLANNNGGYVEVALSKQITRIGATFQYPPGADASSIALVLPQSSWASTFGGATPAGVHFVMLGSGVWNCAHFDNNTGQSNYANATIANMCDGIARNLDIQISGTSVTIKLPDGTLIYATDSRVPTSISNLAIWELYEYASQANRASFSAMWADSGAATIARRDARNAAKSINVFLSK